MMCRGALVFKKVFDVRHEQIADGAVQLSRHMDRRKAAHTGHAVIIAAGQVVDDFRGQADAGRLDRMDQRAGHEQVMGKSLCFLIAHIFRKGSVVAEDNVAQLAGQGALVKEERQALIISHNVMRLAVGKVNGRESVLILFSEGGDDATAIL